jgi:hypothetical protein
MRPARLLIVPIALAIAVVATSPAGAKSPKSPQLVSQMKAGADKSSATACPAKRSGRALRVSCERRKAGLVRYTFKLAGKVHGKVAPTVSGTGSVTPSVKTSETTATVSVKVSGAAQINSVSITYYAS